MIASCNYFPGNLKIPPRFSPFNTFSFSQLALTALLMAALMLPLPGHAEEPVQSLFEPSTREMLSPYRLPVSFYTFAPEDAWAEPEGGWWLGASNWVIRQERQYGPMVQSLGAWADRTLSGSSRVLPNNESYLRISAATKSETGNLFDFEPEVRFKLEVPTAEETLKLIIDSETEDLVPLEERDRDRQLVDSERTDSTTTGALRYITDIGDAVNFTTDIGGRLRLPPEMFWRAKMGKGWQVSQDWNVAAEQRVYYYHTEGWGARSWFGANRSLPNGWRFYASSELEWLHDERKFEAAQIFNIRKKLNNRSELRPRIGVLGESQPNWRTTSYFADITWRYRVYEDWLFAELIPALSFPRGNSFREQTSILFRLEMYFAGTLDRDAQTTP